MKRFHQSRGFSLIELIIVIAIIAVIAATIVPSVSGTQDAAARQKAIAAAEALNMAQTRYRMEKGVSAWAGLDDNARYTALTPYLEYSEASLSDFQTNRMGDYTVDFQNTKDGMMQRVLLKDKAGKAVDY